MKTQDPLDESLHEFINPAPSLNELAQHLKAVAAKVKKDQERQALDECKDFLNKVRPQMVEAAQRGECNITLPVNTVFPDGFAAFCHPLGFTVTTTFGKSISW